MPFFSFLFFSSFIPKTAKITRDVCNTAFGKGTWNERPVWDSWFHCTSVFFQTKNKWNNNYHHFCTEAVPRCTGWWKLGAEGLDLSISHIYPPPPRLCLSRGRPLLDAAFTSTHFTKGSRKKNYSTHIFYFFIVDLTCLHMALSEDYLLTVKNNSF